MKAREAKAAAAINKKNTEENIKIKHEKLKNADTALLYKHFHDKIETSVNAGHVSTAAAGHKIQFSADRFPDGVVTDVVNQLREEGYNIHMSKHIAYNTVTFEISWI